MACQVCEGYALGVGGHFVGPPLVDAILREPSQFLKRQRRAVSASQLAANRHQGFLPRAFKIGFQKPHLIIGPPLACVRVRARRCRVFS